jgi:Toprim-like
VASTQRCGNAGLVFDGYAPSDADYQAIIQTRKLPPESISGLLIAREAGVLHFADVGGFRCWLVSDESKRCAEARRIDGKTFPAIGNLAERKAHTIKGSTKSWPVGLALRVGESRAKHLRVIPLVLVEGGPDLMAAFALLAALPMSECDVQPTAMLGTSASMSAESLQVMAGRHAVVLAHGDQTGRDAAKRWAEQLTKAGCRVKVRDLPDGQDLNDAVSSYGFNAMRGVIQP